MKYNCHNIEQAKIEKLETSVFKKTISMFLSKKIQRQINLFLISLKKKENTLLILA